MKVVYHLEGWFPDLAIFRKTSISVSAPAPPSQELPLPFPPSATPPPAGLAAGRMLGPRPRAMVVPERLCFMVSTLTFALDSRVRTIRKDNAFRSHGVRGDDPLRLSRSFCLYNPGPTAIRRVPLAFWPRPEISHAFLLSCIVFRARTFPKPKVWMFCRSSKNVRFIRYSLRCERAWTMRRSQVAATRTIQNGEYKTIQNIMVFHSFWGVGRGK